MADIDQPEPAQPDRAALIAARPPLRDLSPAGAAFRGCRLGGDRGDARHAGLGLWRQHLPRSPRGLARGAGRGRAASSQDPLRGEGKRPSGDPHACCPGRRRGRCGERGGDASRARARHPGDPHRFLRRRQDPRRPSPRGGRGRRADQCRERGRTRDAFHDRHRAGAPGRRRAAGQPGCRCGDPCQDHHGSRRQ